MKTGRFRKGKKAFKNNRKGKLFVRYDRFLLRIEANRKAAIKIAQSAVIQAMGLAQVRSVQQTIGATPQDKALRIAGIVLDMYAAHTKVFSV